MERIQGQVAVPTESMAYINAHGVWKWGTTTMFNIRNVSLDTGSYLYMTQEKDLAKADKDKKDLYI